MSSWSSYAIELEGCGGPRFRFHLQSALRPDLLAQADVARFIQGVSTSNAEEIHITANRDDMEELDVNVWARAAEAFAKCPHLKAIGYESVFCRPGYTSTKLTTLIQHTPDIEELTIQDGLYCYAECFVNLPGNITKLILKDSTFGRVPLDLATCEALANAIRRCPIRSFELWNATFCCQQDWKLIVDALLTKTELESIIFHRLKTIDKIDFTEEAMSHPHLVQQLAIAAELNDKYQRPFTMSERLAATLEVRSQGRLQLSQARLQADTDACSSTLALIESSTDCVFHFLRREADPSRWSHMPRAA